MELVQMAAEAREGKGKGVCRKIRQKGRIPAVFYGPGTSPVSLSIDPRDLEKVFSAPGGVNTVVELTVVNPLDNSQWQKMAIVKDWQVHPSRRGLLHADFYEIHADRSIVVNVPLRFVGKTKAAAFGGMLEEVRREIAVECLPARIPDFIEVDVSQLDFGGSIHVREITPGEGIKIMDDPDQAIVIVMAVAEEKEVVRAAEEVEEAEAPEEQKPEEAEE